MIDLFISKNFYFRSNIEISKNTSSPYKLLSADWPLNRKGKVNNCFATSMLV